MALKEKPKQIKALIEPSDGLDPRIVPASRRLNGYRTNPYVTIFCRPRLDTVLLIAFTTVFLPGMVGAAGQMPGEGQVGFLYTITHLHPVAYLILFFIFLLSLANLIYQGWIFGSGRALLRSVILRPAGFTDVARGRRLNRRERAQGDRSWRRDGKAMNYRSTAPEPFPEGVVAKRRVVRKSDRIGSEQPTPLDGVNHPLPSFSPADGGIAFEMEADQVKEKPEKRAGGPEFKFTSAVEVPSPEEIDRREREKLTVSGTVRGVDGKGISSVLIYLTDEAGNRLGRSCRTLSETGEFKVQANEPGRYLLHAYKRGLVMEGPEPAVLPIESGKIEGYAVRMAPEGCLIRGKVILEPETESPGDLEVRCIADSGGMVGSTRVDGSGQFKIYGAPRDCRCILEAWGSDDKLLGRSEMLNTGRSRECYAEVRIFSSRDSRNAEPDSPKPPSVTKGRRKVRRPDDASSAGELSLT